jgi:hypothetical protein
MGNQKKCLGKDWKMVQSSRDRGSKMLESDQKMVYSLYWLVLCTANERLGVSEHMGVSKTGKSYIS